MTASKLLLRQMIPAAALGAVMLIIFSSPVRAFPTYVDCRTCHGDFTNGDYTSVHDGTPWNATLMQGHSDLIGNRCNACHGPASQEGVLLNSSDGINFTKGCVGCHGREEDVNDNCTGMVGTLGGVELECGSGAGLRLRHESAVGAGTCSSCHTGDPAPSGEDIIPTYYKLDGSDINDSCDGDGTESQFGDTGLDNDGDGVRDANDPDCQNTGSGFLINAGVNDAWASAEAALQGFFFTVFPDLKFFFLSWFTFDSVVPASGTAVFGAIDQRWVTGGGFYDGDTVTINVELTSGGSFNSSVPLASQESGYGTITIVFVSCTEAILTYDFPSVGLSGQMTLTRVLPDNVALCEMLNAP